MRLNYWFLLCLGRGFKKFQAIFTGERLLMPDYLIAGCGTEVYTVNKTDLTFTLNKEWKEYITTKGNGWDVKALQAFISKEMPELQINHQEGNNEFKG